MEGGRLREREIEREKERKDLRKSMTPLHSMSTLDLATIGRARWPFACYNQTEVEANPRGELRTLH